MIAIIDYGAGNLRSVANAVASLDYQPKVTRRPTDVLGAAAVILPGVGAAADTMRSLRESGMVEVVCQLISEEIANSWQELVSGFSSEKMACTFSTSRLLEEGEQYGMPVQSWRVLLKGIQGFSANELDQEYWLQTAEEDGHWKFNRLLSNGEISFYLELQKLEEEGLEGEAK